MAEFNWLLVIVTVVVALLSVGVSLYLIIIYQHPQDKNQAWFPKFVVLCGFSLAFMTVLLFPLDVANTASCELDLPLSSCTYTFPMDLLWQIAYIANVVIVFLLVPFTIFFYEADSDLSLWRRWLSALLWMLGTFFVLACVIAIPYAVAGYVIYPVVGARSGMLPVSYLNNSNPYGFEFSTCIPLFSVYNEDASEQNLGPIDSNTGGFVFTPAVNVKILTNPSIPKYRCDATKNADLYTEEWKQRATFITYGMGVLATIGWILFMIFGAIGMVALPIDWIRQFIGRPRATIPRSQYVLRAQDLARRAKDIKMLAEALKKEERARGRGLKWRRNLRAVENQLLLLEEDEAQLEEVFPQGEDPEAKWVWTVFGFWFRFICGIIAIGLTTCWVLQIILYILISPPVTPLLNQLFIEADNVFPLFGTVLFALFVFYLQVATMKGNFKFGLNALLFRVHPMRRGATIMSSFLFNVALILLATTACIQFAATAFALYADGTQILAIFGSQLTGIQGLSVIYSKNVFIYCMLGFMVLTFIWLMVKGPDAWKRKRPDLAAEEAWAV